MGLSYELAKVKLDPSRLSRRALFDFEELEPNSFAGPQAGETYSEWQLFYNAEGGAAIGEPQETEQMEPKWYDFDAVPYDEMPEDDIHWYPAFLSGSRMRGEFAFGGVKMVSHSLTEISASEGIGSSLPLATSKDDTSGSVLPVLLHDGLKNSLRAQSELRDLGIDFESRNVPENPLNLTMSRLSRRGLEEQPQLLVT